MAAKATYTDATAASPLPLRHFATLLFADFLQGRQRCQGKKLGNSLDLGWAEKIDCRAFGEVDFRSIHHKTKLYPLVRKLI
jgi:hypothetical protein